MELYIRVACEVLLFIPLIIALIKYVKKSIKEKNWKKLIDFVFSLVQDAETMFDCGSDKKKWVIDMVKKAAELIDYDIDENSLSQLIDDLIEVTKNVNVQAAG